MADLEIKALDLSEVKEVRLELLTNGQGAAIIIDFNDGSYVHLGRADISIACFERFKKAMKLK